jgi:hypothetical protein
MTATHDDGSGSGSLKTNNNHNGVAAGIDMVDIDGLGSHNGSAGNLPAGSQMDDAIDMSMHPSGIIPTLQYSFGCFIIR